ncbi:conserved hypothetical protein [Uncinocarpus reesii 1704]|uniref:Uncharacterized protein n=1 Tax=Uncinocarpus reesii (strain UAMH 1704) TaxID=336963 RepID=C4JGL4_UNCRE|nr:uncharacterized protein UREG_02526 [Uncinocarpus reesii 1704]EEP77677.1 conserved hypothetical protein [Uncinocarpus reesii 1704]
MGEDSSLPIYWSTCQEKLQKNRLWQISTNLHVLLASIITASYIPVVSAANQSGDDFSNNLFSDLAPILTLFGEHVAKQFMAGSLGWADNILFAMAPLGIITAIVGAIRIGGPAWLKAIIGRAREHIATAEVELTTSVSSDACELWNGKAVVRLSGEPKITELVYFPQLGDQPEKSWYSVAAAMEQGKLSVIEDRSAHWSISIAPKPQLQTRKVSESCGSSSTLKDEENVSNAQTKLYPHGQKTRSFPNISLNLSDRRNTVEPRAFAIFGFLLQSQVRAKRCGRPRLARETFASYGCSEGRTSMTKLRSYVRRGMAKAPRSQKLPHGRELDWLATRAASGKDQDRIWSTDPTDDDDSIWTEGCWKWGVIAVSDPMGHRFNPPTTAATRSDDVVRIRQRIGALIKWTTTTTDLATSLAGSIEAVMNSRFAPDKWKEKRELRWAVQGQDCGSIFLSLRYYNGRWIANAAEIDAVLSLWVYAAETEDKIVKQTAEKAASSELPDDWATAGGVDWLRSGHEALRPQCVRLLGHATPSYIRDLTWYLVDGTSDVVRAKELLSGDSPGLPEPKLASVKGMPNDDTQNRIVEIEGRRVVGFCLNDPWKKSKSRPAKRRFRLSPLPADIDTPAPIAASPAPVAEYLATVSDLPIEKLYARDLFSVFIWSVASGMDQLGGETRAHPQQTQPSGTDQLRSIQLWNSILAEVAYAVKVHGGGIFEGLNDIYLSIISPLSWHRKLPEPSCILDHAMRIAGGYEAVGHWSRATDVYVWLFRTCMASDNDDPITKKATAALYEFTHRVGNRIELWTRQCRNVKATKLLVEFKACMDKELTLADERVVSGLDAVFDLQKRSNVNSISIVYDGLPLYNMMFHWLSNDEWLASDAKTKVDIIGPTALHYSVIMEYADGVEKLLGHGNDPCTSDLVGWIPLHYAALIGVEDCVRHLLGKWDPQAQVKARSLCGWTPLHCAAWGGHASIAWALLQDGADIDLQGRDGMTALHCAAEKGHSSIAKLLIEVGATVDILDNCRSTPLHWAVYYGHEEVVQLLVKKRANTAALEANGMTPLHLAAVSNAQVDNVFEIIAHLGWNMKDLAISDRLGLTPLHLAAITGKMALVEHFISNGAEASLVDRQKATPLHWAAKKGR